MNKDSVSVGIIAALALIIGLVAGVYLTRPAPTQGSVIGGSEYNATTTAADAVYKSLVADALVKTGYGTLGSVVITGANTGAINLYDGTTTNALAKIIATIPASAAAGTYTFDVSFTQGLYIDLLAGNMPTTTVTYR